MSVIGGLLERIRGKRQERFSSTAEAYDDCVRKLAVGQEVDLDHLAQLLDELDRSDSDLESDVADKQRRIEARAELDRISQLSKDLPPKRAKIAKLQEELASFIAAKKPVIQALAEEIKMLQLECDRAAFVESELLSVGIPLALAQRRQALKTRQDELFRKQEGYRTRTEAANRAVAAAKVRLVDVEQRLAKSTVGYDKEIISQEAEGLRKRIEAFESQIQNWEPLRLEIEQEQALIHHESSEIRRALMNP